MPEPIKKPIKTQPMANARNPVNGKKRGKTCNQWQARENCESEITVLRFRSISQLFLDLL